MIALKNNLTIPSKTENVCTLPDNNLFQVTRPRENCHTFAQGDIDKDAQCKTV